MACGGLAASRSSRPQGARLAFRSSISLITRSCSARSVKPTWGLPTSISIRRQSGRWRNAMSHFWSEIAVNLAGWKGQKLAGIFHPATFSLLGVGVPLALAAKKQHPESKVVLISGDGAFLCGGLSIEAAFQEKLPIVVVIDNNG